MNPYTLIAVLAVIAGVAVLLVVTWAVTTYDWVSARDDRRLRRAKNNASWQEVIAMKHGVTYVKVEKVGRWGRGPGDYLVLEEHLMGSVREGDANASTVLGELRLEAQIRASDLNVTARG